MSDLLTMPRAYCLKFVLALAAIVVPWRDAPAQAGRAQLFKRDLDFGRIEMMALEGGRVVVKLPKSNDAREIVVVGAIRIHVPLDALVDCFRDAESFFAGDGIVTQIGALEGEPSVAQLSGLRLPDGDFKALSKCEVGDCKVKLTREWIEAMQAIDWSSAGRLRLASAAMLKALVQYLDAYLALGNAALPVYHDKSRPLAAADDFAELHKRSLQYLRHAAELWDYMVQFPGQRSEEIEDRFFWMVEDFGLRPVTSLNHMMIFPDSVSDAGHAVIAMKQIYASHYLQSLVKVATLAPASERYPLRGTYLVLSAQLRFDSEVGGFKRVLLKRELEKTWSQHLMTLRERAEAIHRKALAASTLDG